MSTAATWWPDHRVWSQHLSKTDISLLLSMLCALDLFLGAVAALASVAFVAGVVFERQRHTGGEKPTA